MTQPRVSLTPPYRITGAGKATHLTPQEHILLLALMGTPRLTMMEASEVLWPDPDDMPEAWFNPVRVVMSRVRTRLRPYGWEVVNYSGHGWRLERHADADADSREAQEAPRQAA